MYYELKYQKIRSQIFLCSIIDIYPQGTYQKNPKNYVLWSNFGICKGQTKCSFKITRLMFVYVCYILMMSKKDNNPKLGSLTNELKDDQLQLLENSQRGFGSLSWEATHA